MCIQNLAVTRRLRINFTLKTMIKPFSKNIKILFDFNNKRQMNSYRKMFAFCIIIEFPLRMLLVRDNLKNNYEYNIKHINRIFLKTC